jgi:membrane associated rhomboid family serine protease
VTTNIPTRRGDTQRQGIQAMLAIVAVMWVVEAINAADSYRLDSDGIYPRNISHLWGIFTAPFLHVSLTHLVDNTIPLVVMGLVIALRGAARVALVTVIVIVIGGLGTWLISPSGSVTVGASGLVFGYAGYLLARGFFDRSALEVLTGVVVGVLFGGALLTSLVPQHQISWEGHLAGGVAGVLAAWLLASRQRSGPAAKPAGTARASALAKAAK